MVDFNRLKTLGTEFLGRAGELAEQAKEKAGPLAEQAKEKAGPLAEKAKEAAVKGTHKAADTLNAKTEGKYSDKIESVTGKVDTALRKDTATDKAADTWPAAAADTAADPWPSATSDLGGAGTDLGSAGSDLGSAATSPSDAASTTFGITPPAQDHNSDTAWTNPAAGTESDVTGAAADPGWGEDATNQNRPAGY